MPSSSASRSATAVVCAVVALAGCAAGPPEVPPAMVEVVGALQDGGHVLFLRHAATDATIPSGGDDHRADCGRQRNLTERGRRDAAALGAALRAWDVPVEEVRASPYCRTLDTARGAFGDAVVDERLLPGPGAELRLRPLLAPPREGGNRVLVGHASTMAGLLDVHLEEGEAAVLARDVDGGPLLVGRFSAADFPE